MRWVVIFVAFLMLLYGMIAYLMYDEEEPVVVRKALFCTRIKKSPVEYIVYKMRMPWDR